MRGCLVQHYRVRQMGRAVNKTGTFVGPKSATWQAEGARNAPELLSKVKKSQNPNFFHPVRSFFPPMHLLPLCLLSSPTRPNQPEQDPKEHPTRQFCILQSLWTPPYRETKNNFWRILIEGISNIKSVRVKKRLLHTQTTYLVRVF